MSLKIIGTSHIAKQSINEIKNTISNEKPDLIALELDQERAISLFQEKKRKITLKEVRQIGIKGYLFAKIDQLIQQKLGKTVNVSPGSEMKTAIIIAKEQNIPLVFIDQPIGITLQKFSKELTWKEKYRFLADIVKGIFHPKKQMQQYGLENIDLHSVPEQELIIKLIQHLHHRYPSIYKTLIDDRNRYMVRKIVHILRENPEKKVLVIVGAGHVVGMNELLLKIDVIQ